MEREGGFYIMNIAQLAEQGKFIITTEIGPPKGVDIKEMLEIAELMRGRVDALNVTDQQSSVMRLGSLPVCRLLKESGLEPIFQMTCRDRNRIALQSDLLGAYTLGITNVLCLTGDSVSLGDHPQAKPVFDLDSVSLLCAARQLEGGKDLSGNDLEGAPEFCLGAVVSPESEPLEPQLIKMEKKVKAGAQFFQTQAVYDTRKLEEFMKAVAPLNVPVMVGIVLLRSAGMARFMNKSIAGIHVPDELIEEMEKTEKRAKTSVEIAARLINEMKGLCQGVHIMAIGWEKRVPEVLEAAGL
ncbi:MAG TPA: methylenetetrahydrofolate reductase [Dehalococcoidales bacterium]|nr:methylenetetrahydrofolate reductase [Dehalococcoidales bacterium]